MTYNVSSGTLNSTIYQTKRMLALRLLMKKMELTVLVLSVCTVVWR